MRPSLDPAFLHLPLAHRALHDRKARRPENSLPAIRAAIAAGYGIEVDLQLSADGVAMVFHDDDLERLTGVAGAITERSVDELKALGLLDCDTPMPTLPEVLAETEGCVPLLIELKDQSGGHFGPTDGRLEAATARALQDYAGPAAVMSFNPHMVAKLAELLPETPRGLTTYAFPASDFPRALSESEEQQRQELAEIAAYDAVKASFISHHWADLDRPRVRNLKAQGADVLCWTLRSEQDEAQARQVAQNVTFEGYLAALSE